MKKITLRFTMDSPKGGMKRYTLVTIDPRRLLINLGNQELARDFLAGSPKDWDTVISRALWDKYRPIKKTKAGDPVSGVVGFVYIEAAYQRRMEKIALKKLPIHKSKLIGEYED